MKTKLLALLTRWFKDNGPSVVCFSGGADSGLLLFAASKSSVPFAAIFADSAIRTSSAKERVKKFVFFLNAPLVSINTEELDIPEFVSNSPNRCYFCKKEIFSKALAMATELGFSLVVDGTNASDLSDHRPGLKASVELGVRSPYIELGIEKEEILNSIQALELKLPLSPTTCLATRFPYGTPINPSLFPLIEDIESQVLKLGFSDVRARITDAGFRLEVPLLEIERLRKQMNLIKYPPGYIISVDPAGYRPSGSMYKPGFCDRYK